MGQKSNLNSFNNAYSRLNFQNSFSGSIEYLHLFRDTFFIKQYLIKLFERNACFVQECDVVLIPTTTRFLVYISFIHFKGKGKSKKKLKKLKVSYSFLCHKLKSVFNKYGYCLPVFFIFKNLTVDCKKSFIKQKPFLLKTFGRFKKQAFLRPGLLVFLLLNSVKGKSSVLSAFILRFMRLLHRSKKINFFFNFLKEFVRRSTALRGLKIKIKGRFKKSARSRIKIFQSGSLPLQTIKSELSYSSKHIHTSYGLFGLKV